MFTSSAHLKSTPQSSYKHKSLHRNSPGGKTNILYSKSMQRQILLARKLKEMRGLANKESLVELAAATIALISNGDSFKLFRLIKLRRSGLRLARPEKAS